MLSWTSNREPVNTTAGNDEEPEVLAPITTGREQITQEIGQDYHGNVLWGEDLMQIDVQPPRMAKME